MNNLLSFPSTSIVSKSSDASTKIILVRHAQTTYNEQNMYQGSSDKSVLTEKGHQTAYQTGLALQQFNFDAIYSSSLLAVKQTAQEIITALGKNKNNLPSVLIEPKLTDVNLSEWESLSCTEVAEKFSESYRCWQETPHLFSFDNAIFPVLELFQQAEKIWQEILEKHYGQTVLIVAHGGTNRALISTALGLNPKDYHNLQQSNCGISYLEFSNNDSLQVELKCLNFTNHLGEDLPKLKAGKKGWRWLLVSNEISLNLLSNSCLIDSINNDSINLILTDDCEESENLANNLLQKNNKAVHFPMPQDSFLEIWQQTIFARQKHRYYSNDETLITGLIIVKEENIRQILEKTLGSNIPVDATNNLSVIHYPHSNQQSILQGLLPIDRKLFSQLEIEAA